MPKHLRALLLLGGLSVACPAAAGDVAAAHDAYSRGSKAYKKRDYDAAATLFSKADELAPNAIALEAALRAAVRADRAVLGMELVRRAEQRDAEGMLAEAAEQARAEFRDRVGKLTIVCSPCAPTVDGKSWEAGKTQSVEAGYHLVALDPTDGAEKRLVHVLGGKSTRFAPGRADAPEHAAATPAAPLVPRTDPPSATTAAPVAAPSIRGLSPAWFWASGGVTLALGAAAIASQIDTAGKHEDYLKAPSQQGAADGRAAQTRTHVLLGFSTGALVATAAMGIFAVRWKDTPTPSAKLTGDVAPAPGGATASLRGVF